MLAYIALLVSCPLLSFALLEERATNPTVTIASGALIGTATAVYNQKGVTGLASAYLGVPFASNPPVRFASPVPPQPWTTPLVVQKNKPICIQQQLAGDLGKAGKLHLNNPIDGPYPVEDESCLYLNVFVPPGTTTTSSRPVLFWIYGGNLQAGGAALTAYNASSLAVNESVIVVVPNYRTNIFGFSNSDEIAWGQQNTGFLDQRLALQWVQDNIAQFGGSKDKVTLFGQSAGGWSVKQLLANPPKPVQGYRAAIMQSAGLLNNGSSTDHYNQVLQHFGCSGQASPIACLRKVKATDIVYYIGNNSLHFSPVVGDGTCSGDFTDQYVDNGTFATVPVLIGTTKNEARIFESEAGIDNSTTVAAGVSQLTGLDISKININDLYPPSVAYLNYAIIDRVVTDLLFTCPAADVSNKIKNRQPVWRYRYDAAFANVAVYPNLGAWHFSDVFSVFGSYPNKTKYGNLTDTEVTLSDNMQHYWASFARNPAGGPGWAQFGSQFADIGILGGSNNTVGVSEQSAGLTTDYPCAVWSPILLANGLAF